MLDEMIQAKLISAEDAETFFLFGMDGAGRKWYLRKVDETFMEEVPQEFISGNRISFVDGRRSLLREIRFTLDHVQQKIREYQYDRRATEPATE